MIICPKCGEKNDDNSKFCLKCGAKLKQNEPQISLETGSEKYKSNKKWNILSILFWVNIVLFIINTKVGIFAWVIYAVLLFMYFKKNPKSESSEGSKSEVVEKVINAAEKEIKSAISSNFDSNKNSGGNLYKGLNAGQNNSKYSTINSHYEKKDTLPTYSRANEYKKSVTKKSKPDKALQAEKTVKSQSFEISDFSLPLMPFEETPPATTPNSSPIIAKTLKKKPIQKQTGVYKNLMLTLSDVKEMREVPLDSDFSFHPLLGNIYLVLLFDSKQINPDGIIQNPTGSDILAEVDGNQIIGCGLSSGDDVKGYENLFSVSSSDIINKFYIAFEVPQTWKTFSITFSDLFSNSKAARFEYKK